MQIDRVVAVPSNFGGFVSEIAPEYGAVYGPLAESEYRREGIARISASIAHPAVRTYCASASGEAFGIAQWFSQDDTAHVSFVHVLAPHAGAGIELELLTRVQRDIRDAGLGAVVCETIPFGATELDSAFGALGFRSVSRAILVRRCGQTPSSGPSSATIRPLAIGQRSAAAAIIERAYADHPDRTLHRELSDATRAQRFLDGVASGAFGTADEASLVAISDNHGMTGVLAGCESPAGVGFILQVAVDPARQNQGLGSALLEYFARHHTRRGMDRLALGVTIGNPAERLYTRLGFRPIKRVDAFLWP